jgi:DNA mismatch repair ATPase MutS
VTNVALRYLTDRHIGALSAAFRQVAPVIATGQALQFLSGDDDVQPPLGTLRSDAYSLGRLKTIARWVSGDPFLLPHRPSSLTVLISDIVSVVYEYVNLILLLDANGVYFGAAELRRRGSAFLRLAVAIGDVDAAISVASFRAGRSDWTRPRFRPSGAPAIFKEVSHPLVEDAVPNTITIGPGSGVLITGSNMSGKSTFLRTIGVATVMAQTLNTCLAAEYEAPVFTLRSCIGRANDLLTGRSYYITEVESLLGLVEASADSSSHLFLLDELFRGTNAVERIAAGQAVLQELVVDGNRPKPHIVLAATHDGELVDLLSELFAAYHFGDAVGADGLVFDHRLQPGRATTRNAIALLRLHGAPDTLISRALTCAAALDRQRGTTVVGR